MRNEEGRSPPKAQTFALGFLCGIFAGGLITAALIPPTIEVDVKGEAWNVMLCPKDGNGCNKGGIKFPSKEECESFVKAAATAQPNVGRSCHQTIDTWSIK